MRKIESSAIGVLAALSWKPTVPENTILPLRATMTTAPGNLPSATSCLNIVVMRPRRSSDVPTWAGVAVVSGWSSRAPSGSDRVVASNSAASNGAAVFAAGIFHLDMIFLRDRSFAGTGFSRTGDDLTGHCGRCPGAVRGRVIPASTIIDRHPEVPAQRASKDERPLLGPPPPFEARATRGHLRVTAEGDGWAGLRAMGGGCVGSRN